MQKLPAWHLLQADQGLKTCEQLRSGSVVLSGSLHFLVVGNLPFKGILGKQTRFVMYNRMVFLVPDSQAAMARLLCLLHKLRHVTCIIIDHNSMEYLILTVGGWGAAIIQCHTNLLLS